MARPYVHLHPQRRPAAPQKAAALSDTPRACQHHPRGTHQTHRHRNRCVKTHIALRMTCLNVSKWLFLEVVLSPNKNDDAMSMTIHPDSDSRMGLCVYCTFHLFPMVAYTSIQQ